MNQTKSHACNCTNCPGASCQCGCQAPKAAAPAPAAQKTCACKPAGLRFLWG